MVQSDGISDAAISSNQTVDIEDIQEDDSFETDMIVDENDDDEDDDDEDDDSTDNNSTDAPINDQRRILAESSVALVYTQDGYEADNDAFESGVVVDDEAFSEAFSFYTE